MIRIHRPNCPNPAALQTNYKHPDNKKALKDASYKKCMYCEGKITHISFGDVEHIKPKSLFPELEFDWSNLGFVCSKCNIAKHNKFDEQTQYINPYDEDPKNHLISIGALLMHKNGSERGEITVHDIDLNRKDLVEKRWEKLKVIGECIDKCLRTSNPTLKKISLEALMKESEEDKEFSLFIITLFKIHEIS